jgi:hypothetical protein
MSHEKAKFQSEARSGPSGHDALGRMPLIAVIKIITEGAREVSAILVA